jgi:hypothetical protein
MRFPIFVLLALCTLALGEETVVADKRVQVTQGLSVSLVDPPHLLRPDAPVAVLIKLTSHTDALRDGRIELAVSEGRVEFYRWLSDDVTLTKGDRVSTVLLPPLHIDNFHDDIELSVVWIEQGQRIELGRQTIGLASNEMCDHAYVCFAMSDSNDQLNGALREVLQLERYAIGKGDPRQSALRTHITPISADLVPQHGIGWCAYDVVAIGGMRLADLKSKHAEALAQWVRAGGSLLVVRQGALPQTITDMALQLGATTAALSSEQHARVRPGLGRLVIASASADITAENVAWRESAAFLWKLNRDRTNELKTAGTLPLIETKDTNAYSTRQYVRDQIDLRPAMTELLWPEQVTIIPLSLILLIYVTFVLMVGPGDWYLLGLIKARRLTWVLFPVVAIACTWFTVALSRHYLGSADSSQVLDVIDVGPRDSVLRHDQIELMFTGSNRALVRQPKQALWSSLEAHGASNNNSPRMFRGNAVGNGTIGMPRYEGSLSGEYKVEQAVSQWTPALRREMSFASCALPWRLDTDTIASERDFSAWAAKVGATLSDKHFIATFHAGKITKLSGALSNLYGERSMRQQNFQQMNYAVSEDGRRLQRSWLDEICTHQAAGWFRLSTQSSPCGGASFEDFAVHDASDNEQWLLIVAERRGNSVNVVRRLFRFSSPGGF